jgi:hypothetical protein
MCCACASVSVYRYVDSWEEEKKRRREEETKRRREEKIAVYA